MINLAGLQVLLSKGQLALEHRQGARTELDGAIFLRLCPVLLSSENDNLPDLDGCLLKIAIESAERDFLRLAQAREEPELIVVTDWLAPFNMQ